MRESVFAVATRLSTSKAANAPRAGRYRGALVQIRSEATPTTIALSTIAGANQRVSIWGAPNAAEYTTASKRTPSERKRIRGRQARTRAAVVAVTAIAPEVTTTALQ